ncbi:tRNA (adenosine(37)-N6)-threonylcarbamoyltransferase complex dimerization subunit type 1 TsaB [Bordetella genomosp. 13]|uniref:[Ribosomal protein bS18]-alanine N-acetyltransferase n=1 Tax=Bordetella genomosp. 13 TaxID=463040 RepID=A0A1W6ZEY0_9BORD|nr:tRNA (adenosine(37)-N6)-threonylcarbamoyltransferase complex dimerization subunit type 1 TsaB [Bordetella genomosp. 13]ARP95938.1 bifunctional tRNA (adenosine(37)-N6)-threonylcarbamoyltransferase complex dimerization subunit type 1 TsaB/ribosomal-protein-alanine acetyltransferase RimI [Bordetella genomosp. 13]
MNLNILAFETSSSRCGVALLRDDAGPERIDLLEHDGAQEHAERLLPMARELLARAGLGPAALHAVAFGQGPGGFTGLRVACGVAQGVALGLGVPVLPVVSHLAVADDSGAQEGQVALVALDARMEEVYLAAYLRLADSWREMQSPMLIAAAEVMPWALHQLPQWSGQAGRDVHLLLAGDAWDAYPALAEAGTGQHRSGAGRPSATAVARLAHRAWLRGEAVPPEEAAPLYVRDKVAFTTAERMAGQGGNPRAASQMAAAAACVPSVVEASSASAPDVPEAPGVGAPAEAQSVDSSGAAQPVEVQPMTAADLDDIADLEARVQAFPWTRGNFADGLAAGYPGCVLRQDGRLAGFCVLMLAPDVAHLLVIAVQPALHRRGLGNRLLAWCEGRASQAGLPGILLEVRPSNPGALRFYERAGYLKVGVRKGYYPSGNGKREDALVMYKSIARSGE